jgi:uncharacterized membrane protein YeaQ/YmgE (transglycosylase-associated protein family)
LPGPTITFAFIVATLFGAAFHVVRGGDEQRLALYLLAGWVGFALGHLVGVMIDLRLLNVGPLRMVTASIGAVAALVFAQAIATRTNR